jgi:hypothetical protein
MMNLFKCAISIIGIFLTLYLIGSFIAWELNPAEWGANGRAALCLFAIPTLIFALGLRVIFQNSGTATQEEATNGYSTKKTA